MNNSDKTLLSKPHGAVLNTMTNIEDKKQNCDDGRQDARESRVYQTILKQLIFWCQVRDVMYKQIKDSGLKDIGEDIALYIVQRPVLGLVLVVCAVTVGIPIVIGLFVVFSIVGISFVGFFLFEGAVLALAAAALAGFILAVAAAVLVLLIVTFVSYSSIRKGFAVWRKTPEINAVAKNK